MPTLLQYLLALAPTAGDAATLTTTSVSSGATNLIVSGLISSNAATSRFGNQYVYMTSGALAGQQQQITEFGLDPATGTLTLAGSFTGTPASGVTFLLTSKRPVLTTPGGMLRRGYRELINDALARIPVYGRIAVTGIANVLHYTLPLTTYPWLANTSRVVALYDPNTDSNDNPSLSTRQWSIRMAENAPLLEVSSSFLAGETFWLGVARPGNSYIYTPSAWAEQTDPNGGLVGITDEAVPTVIDVRAVGEWLLAEQEVREAETEADLKVASVRANILAQRAANRTTFDPPNRPARRATTVGNLVGGWRSWS